MENASSKVVFRLTHEDNLSAMAKWLFMGVMNPDEVKHELYSTKVMAYREELRTSTSRSSSKSVGGGAFAGTTASKSSGGFASGNENCDANSWGESFAESGGDSHTWTESESEGETTSSVLIPIFGKELSHVQFRSLEEQLFRAMARPLRPTAAPGSRAARRHERAGLDSDAGSAPNAGNQAAGEGIP